MPNPTRPAIDVCITADIEFDINHSLSLPDTHSPTGYESVDRPIGGASHGLGFMLRAMRGHDLHGTFFVEVMNAHYFGIEPMQRCVQDIEAAGPHGVELHMHPCWRYYRDPKWRETIRQMRKNDSMADRGDEAVELVAEGKALFRSMVGREPVAYRSPGLSVDTDVHRALLANGIRVSSSVGMGVFEPRELMLRFYQGARQIEGVKEIPVTSFREAAPAGRSQRLLTLTGTPWPTMRRLLEWAWWGGVSPIVLLTHAAEFSTVDGVRGHGVPPYRPNRQNQARFERLCGYLGAHRDRFRTTTFEAAHERWAVDGPADAPCFHAPVTAFAHRVASHLRGRFFA
jgi:hypothetical protein